MLVGLSQEEQRNIATSRGLSPESVRRFFINYHDINEDTYFEFANLEKITGIGRVSLAGASTPPRLSNFSIRIRGRITNGLTGKFVAAVYESGVNRSGDIESAAVSGALADYYLYFSEVNAANVTDYSDLELRFWGHSVTGNAAIFEIAEIALIAPTVATTPIAGTDTGAGSEGSVIFSLIPGTDSGTDSEASTLTALLFGTDTGTDSEVAAYFQLISVTDVNGTITENAIFSATKAGADVNGTLTELAAMLSVLSGTDTGSDSETSTLAALIPSNDVNSITTESATYRYLFGVTDINGSPIENAVIVFAVSGTDTGGESDSGALTAVYSVTDSGAGSDASSRQGFYSTSDSGSGTDSSLLVVALSGADSGSDSESGAVIVGLTLVTGADVGSGSEIVLILGKAASDSGSGAENTFSMGKTVLDVGSSVESAKFNGTFFGSDQVSPFNDSAFLQAVVSALDSGTDFESFSIDQFEVRAASDLGFGADNAASFEKLLRVVEQVLSANAPDSYLRKASDDDQSKLLKVT